VFSRSGAEAKSLDDAGGHRQVASKMGRRVDGRCCGEADCDEVRGAAQDRTDTEAARTEASPSCKNYDRLTERVGATKELCERRASSVRQGYLNRQICPLPVTRRPGVGLAEGRRRETYFPAKAALH
jgi:hypothetical protein